MSAVAPNRRPTRASGVLAVVAAIGAVSLVAPATLFVPLAVELVGVAGVAAGVGALRRGWRFAGVAVGVAGLAVVLGALGQVWVRTGDPLAVFQFAPGMLGGLLVAAAVLPHRGRGSRFLVKAGTGLVFVTVMAAALVQRPSLPVLLASGVATVVAWDTGEYAVGLGAQVGRHATTWTAEGVHVASTAAVGVVAVLAGVTVSGLGSPRLSLAAFVVLVSGLVLLTVALHD